jgi:pilus assembly protein CpaE
MTIRRVYERRPKMTAVQAAAAATAAVPTLRPGHRGYIIVVFGPKGGVGTTTIATSLAVGFALGGATSVLVDTDLQFGNVGIFLNMQTHSTIVDLARSVEDAEVEEIDPEDMEHVLSNHKSGCKVLLAPSSPEEAELVSPASLPKLLDHFSQYYDYIVVDTGSQVTEALLRTLDAASRILVVTTPDIPALNNAKLFYGLLPKIGCPAEKTMLVLNRMERRGITVQQAGEFLKRPVVGQIDNDPAAMDAVNRGEPLISLDPRTVPDKAVPSVRGLKELLKSIQKDLEERGEEDILSEAPPETGILTRLRRRRSS